MDVPVNPFKRALLAGQQQIGLWCTLSNAFGIEVVAGAGFDWLLLDTEHSPGDVLTVETKPGETWEKESKRAGKLTFRERITEYRDQNGELVITARGVGVTTERPVDQG